MTLIDGGFRVAIAAPMVSEAEIETVVQVLRFGDLTQGRVVAEFEAAFAEMVGSAFAVATSSGTSALHLSLLAHGIGPGDEVITSSFSFIATANAILYTGARPVFADIDPATLNITAESVAPKISPRTKAILPVHIFGSPCDMAPLVELAAEHELAVIEDACQAHGASISGRRVGSFGTGSFSFYPTKNMTTGEGGMITTSDPVVADRASRLRLAGMNAKERHLHDELGFNARMTNIQAAIGLGQLAHLEEWNARRSDTAAYYDESLGEFGRQRVLPGATPVWHQYTLLTDPGRRDYILNWLVERGIGAKIYYQAPIHRQPSFRNLGFDDRLPVTEQASKRVLSIPVHPRVSDEERAYIAREIKRASAAYGAR